MGFLDGLLEGGQIDLVNGTFADVDIDSKAVHLLVVQEEVLEAAGHAVGLGGLDVGHYHLAGQIGVLAHVFKGATVQWQARHVHARTE